MVRTRPKADLQLAVWAVEHIDGRKADLGRPVFMADGSAGAEGRITDDRSGENLAIKHFDPRLDKDRLAVPFGGRREVGIGARGDGSSAPAPPSSAPSSPQAVRPVAVIVRAIVSHGPWRQLRATFNV